MALLSTTTREEWRSSARRSASNVRPRAAKLAATTRGRTRQTGGRRRTTRGSLTTSGAERVSIRTARRRRCRRLSERGWRCSVCSRRRSGVAMVFVISHGALGALGTGRGVRQGTTGDDTLAQASSASTCCSRPMSGAEMEPRFCSEVGLKGLPWVLVVNHYKSPRRTLSGCRADRRMAWPLPRYLSLPAISCQSFVWPLLCGKVGPRQCTSAKTPSAAATAARSLGAYRGGRFHQHRTLLPSQADTALEASVTTVFLQEC
mmetsp:Transcript_16079/g.33472  ORF Transcript_16079/g.33472 Transcript_16079/m.33472 type:complete len:261 (+) Transcript_16079:176-958(+)